MALQCKRGQFGTRKIWRCSVKGIIWHRNEKRTIWHQDNLAPQCKRDNLAPGCYQKKCNLAEYIQYLACLTDTCFPAQRPKGAQTPSNCNISLKCLLRKMMVPNCPFYTAVPNCPWCQIVPFSLRCQIVPFSWRCQIVPFSWRCQIVPFSWRCQIVLFSWRCQIVLGAKLSSFTLLVPNCPGAKLSSVPNCPRCQIVLGAKLSPNRY